MSLPNVNFLSITESQRKTVIYVDITNQLKMLTDLEIQFSKWNSFHLETLLGQLLTTQQPHKRAGKCLRTTRLCCAVLSNTVPAWWSRLPFPVVILHQWQMQTLLEDPMHGLDASGQRGSEETWPPDVWEIVNLFTAITASQAQTERCRCWDLLLFLTSLQFWSILVKG